MLSEKLFSTANICAVGNVNRDIRFSPIVACDSLFKDGETRIHSLSETVGGGGANCVCTASALGARSGLLAKIGHDRLGQQLETSLIRHGVTPHLERSADCATGTSLNLAFTSGQRHFLSSLPNGESLAFEDLNLEALQGYSHLLRADVWFSEAMLFQGNAQLFRHARALGMRISLDINWDPQWTSAGPQDIVERKLAVRRVLPYVDLVHGNIRELQAFTDTDNIETGLRRLEEWGTGAVVVHMGSRGAGYYKSGRLQLQPPAPVKCHRNTTGTGDVLSTCIMLLDTYDDIPIDEKLITANRIVAEFIEGRRLFIPLLASEVYQG